MTITGGAIPTLLVFLALAAAPAVGQGVIDFETIPGDVPADGLPISDQFLTSHGVTFSLEDGSAPVLAQIGAPATAFNSGLGDDTPVASAGGGAFFLTDDGEIGTVPPPLVIRYETPTSAASGLIYDIDGEEAFLIEARDELDAVLETFEIASGDPGTGDAEASLWSFQRARNEIYSIRVVASVPMGQLFGLGFDNFNASGVCPSAPVAGCVDAAKASLSIKEKKPGSEKWKLKLAGFEVEIAQVDFGSPVDGATRYDVCLYDDADQLAGGLSIARAGDMCGPKQKPCWKAKKDKGWTYKDPDAASDGVKKIAASGGPAGKGKLQLQAGNKEKKGQIALPTGVAGALEDSGSALIQVVASDAACFEAALPTVKKAEAEQFKGKAP